MGADVHGVHLTSRTSAPSVSPVSLADVKSHLRVSSSSEDALIQLYIDAATASAEAELGKLCITQTWTESVEKSTERIDLTKHPVQSLTSVQYYDVDNVLQTMSAALYTLVKGEDFAYVESDNWPQTYDRADAVTFTYVTGFGDAPSDVPANIKQAIFLLVGQYYEHRVNVDETKHQEMPRAATHLLGQSRIGWYG